MNDPEFWFQAMVALARGLIGGFVFFFVGGLLVVFILEHARFFGLIHDSRLQDQLLVGSMIGAAAFGFFVSASRERAKLKQQVKAVLLGLVLGAMASAVVCLVPMINRMTLPTVPLVGMLVGGAVGFARARAREVREAEVSVKFLEQLPLWDREMDG